MPHTGGSGKGSGQLKNQTKPKLIVGVDFSPLKNSQSLSSTTHQVVAHVVHCAITHKEGIMKSAAELLRTGESFEERGDYVRAELYYRRALSATEVSLENQQLELVPCLYNLGLVQFALEKFSDAERHLTRLYVILFRALGETHEDTLEIRELLTELRREAA